MIRFIVTDLDGVIRHFPEDRDREIELFFDIPEGRLMQCAFGFDDLSEVICGRISDEKWRENIANRLANYVELASAKMAVERWSKFSGIVDFDVLKIYASKNIPIVLLTNATDRLERDLLSVGIIDLFAKRFNSSEIGFSKPSDEIFLHLFKMLNCSPDEIVFIDDSPANILCAKKHGCLTHKFTDVSALKMFLETHSDQFFAN